MTSLCAGNEEGVFRIDPVSGVLRTVAALDHERRATYILTVQAADSLGGMNSLSSVTEVSIVLSYCYSSEHRLKSVCVCLLCV